MRESRSRTFTDLLDAENIDLEKLRKLCLSGCPEDNETRPLVWKILLNYLPSDRSLWENTLSRARTEYESYLSEFVVSGGKQDNVSDHPLNSDPTSNWREYFDDNQVLLQINKDCRRLYPELDFFRRPTQYPCHKVFSVKLSINDLRSRIDTELTRSHAVASNTIGAFKLVSSSGDSLDASDSLLRAACDQSLSQEAGGAGVSRCPGADEDKEEDDALPAKRELHWEVVQRIIFIFYKINRGSSYVQGMNEVAGPLYYVLANHPNSLERKYAEADTFFCFNNLMAELQSVFNRNFDQDFGIGSKMTAMMHLLGTFDAELLRHLTGLHLEPAHFAFRWITLLLAREFLLPDVLRLWDCILADKHRFDLVPYICCSMLILARDELLQCDFPHAVRLLQNYPYTDVGCIISHALALFNRHCGH